MLIDRCDLISTGILAFGFVVEEFAIVRYILYSTVRGLLNALVVDYPCDVRWRFANDFHVKVERFVLAHSYVP